MTAGSLYAAQPVEATGCKLHSRAKKKGAACLHPHLVIRSHNRPVVEVVLLYEQGHQVHVLEDEVRLGAQAEVLGLNGQQFARCLKGAHLKVFACAHLALHHTGIIVTCLTVVCVPPQKGSSQSLCRCPPCSASQRHCC